MKAILVAFVVSVVTAAYRSHRPTLAHLVKVFEHVPKERECYGTIERKDVVRKYATMKTCGG